MEKRIKLNDYTLNVQFIGNGITNPNTPVFIFLHEALGSIVQWKQFPHHLCQLMHLPGIIIERRGHGKSDPFDEERTNGYLHEYADELHETLLETLPLGKKVILIGHSDGGTIALLYAKLFPKNVIRIVTIAAHTFVEPETIAGIPPTIDAYRNGKLNGLKTIHGEKTDQLFYAWANTWLSPTFLKWDIRTEIIGISCPILAIQGEQDQYGTVKQLTSISLSNPTAQINILSDCKHHPHLEKPTETLGLINDFLNANANSVV